MSYQRFEDERPPATAPSAGGEGYPNISAEGTPSSSSAPPSYAAIPIATYDSPGAVVATPIATPHILPAVQPYAPLSANFIAALPGSGQAARLCQMRGCVRAKAFSSHFCSTEHEQKHIGDVARRENLSAICTRYLATNASLAAFRCMTCEYRPHQHCCASCVIICHEGHDVVEIKGGSATPCDCGGDPQCSCMPKGKTAPSPSFAAKPSSALLASGGPPRGGDMGNRDQCYQRSHGRAHQACAKCSRWLCSQCVHVHEGRVMCPGCYTSAREQDCCAECCTWCCIGLCCGALEAAVGSR